jgi:hypothetical protein
MLGSSVCVVLCAFWLVLSKVVAYVMLVCLIVYVLFVFVLGRVPEF